MKKKINKLFFIFICATAAFSQTLEVTATVDRTSLSVGQQVSLTVEFSGKAAQKIGNPELPDMQGYLKFLGAGGTSQNISFVNGNMSVSKSFTYYYQAAKEGQFEIPSIKVNHDGNTYTSAPILINISKAAAGQTRQQNSRQPAQPLNQTDADLSDDNLFLRAIPNKRKVYQGEPVLVNFKIYSRVHFSYGISKLPETTGFWAEDFEMPQQPDVQDEVINGIRYSTAIIKKMALFPTSPGEQTIGSMVAQCDVRVRRGSRDVFDSFFDDPFFGRTIRKTIQTDPITVEVMPLPKNNQPPDFDGAVGSYVLQATVDKTNVKTDEAVTLTITVSGTGNIKMLPAPSVTIPPDFEQYDPDMSMQVRRRDNKITGSKTYEYVLVPRFAGAQRIRPIRFPYFDPQAGRYVVRETDEIVINVEQGDQQFVAAGGSGLSKEEIQLVDQDIRFIKLQSPKFYRIGHMFYKSSAFFMLALLPLVLVGAGYGYKVHADKLSSNVAYARSRKANAMAKRRLTRAKMLLKPETQDQFFAEVSDALIGFISDKLNMSKAGYIRSQVDKALRRENVNDELIAKFFQALDTCDQMRFAPQDAPTDVMNAMYAQARDLIIKLEKQL